MTSYLQDREQYTVVGACRSKKQPIKQGVPQGSTLAPLLFSMYTNDLPLASNFQTTLFADDTFLALSDDNIENLQASVNLELEKFDDWMRWNRLSLNCKKTSFMLFVNQKPNSNPFSVKIGTSSIQHSDRAKYLGVWLDEQLSWSPHISHLECKLSKCAAVLFKIRHYVNEEALKSLYYRVILRPCLLYTSPSPRDA